MTSIKLFPGFAKSSSTATNEEKEGADADESVDTKPRLQDLGTILVTSGKDGMLKFWDMGTRHCCFTLAVASAEVLIQKLLLEI